MGDVSSKCCQLCHLIVTNVCHELMSQTPHAVGCNVLVWLAMCHLNVANFVIQSSRTVSTRHYHLNVTNSVIHCHEPISRTPSSDTHDLTLALSTRHIISMTPTLSFNCHELHHLIHMTWHWRYQQDTSSQWHQLCHSAVTNSIISYTWLDIGAIGAIDKTLSSV